MIKLTTMKINFLLLSIITATITSCSSSYKTGQTPDDVYYSPARMEGQEVRREGENKTQYDNSTGYSSVEDRTIRRRINNRRYRRYDDRYDYPYGYNYPYGYGYNNYPPVYVNPKIGKTTTNQPRQTNLGAYKPNTTDSSSSYNPKLAGLKNSSNPSRTFGNTNTSTNKTSGVGNFIRRVFTPENGTYNSSSNSNNNYRNNNTNSSSTSTRTFEPRSTNNNSSSSSSSETKTSSNNSTPVRTFKKD